jgi:hypothetical protein
LPKQQQKTSYSCRHASLLASTHRSVGSTKLVVERQLLACSDPAIREEAATFMAAYTPLFRSAIRLAAVVNKPHPAAYASRINHLLGTHLEHVPVVGMLIPLRRKIRSDMH